MQQILYAVYGSQRSFYGNISYAAAPKLLQVYGAWPEEKPAQPDMLVSDWQEPISAEIAPTTLTNYAEEIASRIAIIKQLKDEIEAEQHLKRKNMLREHMRIERLAKERAFRLKAMIDEEETLFILLN